ncbi:MAG: response regulator [Desulfobacteraceae bacterium]|nr:response regulator [Desulfobacteraceae bacterium]
MLRLHGKINAAITAAFAITALLFIGIDWSFQTRRIRTFSNKIHLLLQTLVERDHEALANEIFENRLRAIRLRVQQMRRVEGICAISVFDQSAKPLYHDGYGTEKIDLDPEKIKNVTGWPLIEQELFRQQASLSYLHPIDVIGERLGYIRIHYSLEDVQSERRFAVILYVMHLVTLLIVMFFMLRLVLKKAVLKPINSLMHAIDQMKKGKLRLQVPVTSYDEIGKLSTAFNKMSARRASLPAMIVINQIIESDALVKCDPTQIHQIVMNLCANASQAMEKGGLLTVKLTSQQLNDQLLKEHSIIKPGNYIKLTVTDTGHGIPEHHLESVFEPYFTTKKKEEGTGLGLSVIHGIVQSLEGGITIISEVGKGTTFEIYLPVIESGKPDNNHDYKQIQTGHESILFVDDEPIIAHMAHQYLDRLGYCVVSVASSSKALELIRSNPQQFDLVITDMTMPKITGDQLAKAIIEIRPDLPIILCTGYSKIITPEQAEALGIRAMQIKPLELKQFAHTVRRVLNEAGQD